MDKSIFDFLKQIEKNNNREWFSENKNVYDKAAAEAKIYFTKIYDEYAKRDHLEAMKIYRIYRDVRFSKDKTPYKNHFSMFMARTKPFLRGGYYLHIEPGKSFAGGGFWEPNKEDLFRIRKELELDDKELRAIIEDKTFKDTFGTLTGDELISAPKGFDKNHPAIDLIRKKQFLVSKSFTDKEVLAADFTEKVVAVFTAMRPFFDYMSEVLTTDLNGESLYK